MCGIAGFAGEDASRIGRMTECLVHRGPDGNAVTVKAGASLGHARLAILDPRPVGDQPMWNDDGTIAIVFNGEIYNYRRLRDSEGLTCKTNTDTEVVLRLYEKHGLQFVPRLQGMFAFGIYDTRDRSWHLARDRAGIKPLYIAYPEGKLHFASEMRALMRALPAKPALNMRSLSQYMRLQYVPGPETLCEGIESLPQGTLLSWKGGKEERVRFEPDVHAEPYASKADFQKNFPALMQSVVADQLISDKPVGVFLSGGMDSSIILHHMCEASKSPVPTFTVRFDATADEGEARFNQDANLAQLTAKHYKTDHHEITLTAEDCRRMYKDVARALDSANADAVAPAQYALAHEAKKHVDVVLNGSGGDELFGGYPRYRVARILKSLRAIPSPVRAVAGRLFGYPPEVLRMQPGPELALRLLTRHPNEIKPLVKGAWFEPTATDRLFKERYTAVASVTPVHAFMEFDRDTWLVDESLRLSDATTMASGLECRVPFLDPRIVEASRNTNENWLIGFKRTKALLKDTYLPLLPEHLRSLPKAGFYPPFAKWLRRECAPLVEEMLEGKRINAYFDTSIIRGLFEDHKTKRGYHLHMLSALVQLHFWFTEIYDAD